MKSIAASIVVLAGAFLWVGGALAGNNGMGAQIGGFVLCLFGFGVFYITVRFDKN